jgi:hypothetical protein
MVLGEEERIEADALGSQSIRKGKGLRCQRIGIATEMSAGGRLNAMATYAIAPLASGEGKLRCRRFKVPSAFGA